jgi:hypothetical protein
MKILSSKLKEIRNAFIASLFMILGGTIITLSLIALLSSCSNDPIINDPIRIDNKTPIQSKQSIVFSTNLKPRIQTRSLTDAVTVGSDATVMTGVDMDNQYNYTSNYINELEAKTPSDEIFATSTSQTLRVFYPSDLLSFNKTLQYIEVSVANSQAEVNNNKDLVYSTVNVARLPNTPFAKTELTFNHLFSLLRIKLIQGTSDDNIEDITVSYNAPNLARIQVNGNVKSCINIQDHYFFESDRILQGATVKSISLDAVVLPIQGTSTEGILNLNGKTYKLMDLFSDKLEGGKIYTVEVTLNKKNVEFGNITIESWNDGSNSTIIIEQ